MRGRSALLASSLLLGLILVSTIVAALVVTPKRGTPSQSVVVASTASSDQSQTTLTVFLRFPNGTLLTSARLDLAGRTGSVNSGGGYVFSPISPGTYAANLSRVQGAFLAPTLIRVQPGSNVANLTVYPLKVFVLILSSAVGYNGSVPGPAIQVANGTAVSVVIHNNSTLIHNFAVVRQVFNTSSATILFSSLSQTMNAGGSANDTFIVNQEGYFFYEDLIGSHARDGDYGYFTVLA